MTLADISEATPRYEDDFVLWAQRQAELLRARQFSTLDIANLSEEVMSMVGHERRALKHRLEVLITHLLKCELQPGSHTRSWDSTILEQRERIADILADSPSLRADMSSVLPQAYQHAAKMAAAQTGVAIDGFPKVCPFSLAEILEQP